MKKTARKVLLMACSALLLVCLTVGATVAYLTSTTGVVTNTFTVGQVEIDLDETDVTVYGVKDTDARVKANEYKLIPGHTYTKDPTVHVKPASESAYLFVTVNNGIYDIEDETTIAKQMETNGWTLVNGYTNLYVYEKAVAGNEIPEGQTADKVPDVDVPVFASFKLKDDAVVTGYESASITIKACAVQKDGLELADAADIAAEKLEATAETPADPAA